LLTLLRAAIVEAKVVEVDDERERLWFGPGSNISDFAKNTPMRPHSYWRHRGVGVTRASPDERTEANQNTV